MGAGASVENGDIAGAVRELGPKFEADAKALEENAVTMQMLKEYKEEQAGSSLRPSPAARSRILPPSRHRPRCRRCPSRRRTSSRRRSCRRRAADPAKEVRSEAARAC